MAKMMTGARYAGVGVDTKTDTKRVKQGRVGVVADYA